MAVLLKDARNFAQDKLDQKVIDEFRKDPLFENMVFDDTVSGNAGGTLGYSYNRVKVMGSASFREIGKEFTPAEAKTELVTAILKPFGGSFEVDRVLQNHVKGITTQIGFQLDQKIKATKALFADALINGDTASDAKSFDGVDKAVKASTTDRVPKAAIDLSTVENIVKNGVAFMYELDQMLAELDGEPTALLVNRKLKAIMDTIARKSGSFSTGDLDSFGNKLTKYGNILLIPVGDKPGTSDSIIPIDGASGETSIYAVRIGLDGVHALSPDGSNNIKTYLPDLTQPGAVKKGEVEMVSAIAIKSSKSAGKLSKIKVQ